MESAPAWVSYAALAMSAAALGVSWLQYRAGAPRLTVRAQRLAPGTGVFPDGGTVQVTVTNTGRAAVTLDRLVAVPYAPVLRGPRRPVSVGRAEGPRFPLRLDAQASETWWLDALPIAREYHRLVDAGEIVVRSPFVRHFHLAVAAGNGELVAARTAIDALEVIAAARQADD